MGCRPTSPRGAWSFGAIQSAHYKSTAIRMTAPASVGGAELLFGEVYYCTGVNFRADRSPRDRAIPSLVAFWLKSVGAAVRATISETREMRREALAAAEVNDKFTIQSTPRTIDDEIGVAEVRAMVARAIALSGLRDREAAVIRARFFGEATLRGAGGLLGVSRERIRQIESKALSKIRRSYLRLDSENLPA